jgi:ATP phosphoribosyltransferase regulatory subunit
VVRVATKYPRITEAYFADRGVQVEIVKLHGNIELAPLIGLADQVVDITATGTTLRDNHLRIVDEVMSSSARFVANPVAVRIDSERVMDLAARQARAAGEVE